MTRLTKKDIACITRLLQGSIFEQNIFDGCRYCKYRKKCESTQIKKRKMHIDKVRVKLQRITGIYMGYIYNPGNPQKKNAGINVTADVIANELSERMSNLL